MYIESNITLTDPRTQKGYLFHVTPFRLVFIELLRFMLPVIGRIEVSGLENLPQRGGVVLTCNHVSNYDVFPMQLALPRPVFFMGKAELFQNPLMDWMLRNLGGFPVYRGERDSWALEHAAQVLANQQVLGIFPEGKRSQGRGLAEGKSGAARLAMEAGCPLLPMSIQGTKRMFQNFPKRTLFKIRLGEPIWPEADMDPNDLTDLVMLAIARLLPPELRGVYKDRLGA